jgi:hypothetical protein
MTFQSVIDLYYDTEIIQHANQGMVKAFASNKEIDEANAFLSDHESGLIEEELYDDAKKTIEKMQKIILKDNN